VWTAGIAVAMKPTSPTSGRLRKTMMRATLAALAWAIAPGAAASAVSVQELVDRVSLPAMQAHVAALAGQRRTPEEQAAAAGYIVGQLEASGYTVSRSPVIDGDNLIARAVGRRDPEATFVIGAHYDSVEGSPGADDNATSVAALLEIARVLAEADLGASVEFVAFADEELGLQGSRRYARATRESLRDVLGMFSFEMIAYTCTRPGCQVVFPDLPGCLDVSNANANVGTFIAAVGNDRSAALLQGFVDAAAAYVPDLQVETALVAEFGSCQPDTRRSDHLPYWEEGYPALMLTDTANFRNPNYHRATDTPDTLDFPFALRVAKAALGTAVDAVGLVDPTPPRTTPTPVATATPTAVPEGARPVLFIGLDVDEAVHVVDLATPDRIDALLPVGHRPDLFALSPDRRTLYVLSRETNFNAGDGGVTVVDLAGVVPPHFVPLGAPTSLAVSPDGLHLYAANHPNGPVRTFEVIDTTTACLTTVLGIDGETGFLNGLRLDPEGERAYLADPSSDRVLIVDPLTPRVTGSFEIGSTYANDTPVGIALDAAGALAYVANNTSGTVSVVDLASGAILKNVLVHHGARDVALTPDGTLGVVTASGAGDERGVDLFDTRTRRAVGSIVPPDGASVDSLAIGPDGLTAYVTGCGDVTLVIDLPSRTVTGTIPLGDCSAPPILAAILPPGDAPPRPTPLSSCPTPLRIDAPPSPTATGTATFPTPTVTATKTLARTLTPSTTPVLTATNTALPTPAVCAGDCDGNRAVTIDELLRAVGVALDLSPTDACAAADADHNERVSVDELIQAVNRALNGC
jgi:DNA-binding beta-propeller fold protein YncE